MQPYGTPPQAPPTYAPAPPPAAIPGKVRNPAVNILLFVVTLGIYWFVWIYKAFTEVAATRGRDIKAGMWVGILVAVWVVNFGVGMGAGLMAFVETLQEQEEGAPAEETPGSVQDLFAVNLTPLGIAAMAIGGLFYILQLFYLKDANQAVNDILQGSGLPPGPKPAVAITFCVLYAIGSLPFIGIVASLAGLIVAIVWIVQIQNAINRYWQPRQAAYPGPPPQAAGWQAGPAPVAPQQPQRPY